MVHPNRLILAAVLLIAVTSLAGTWIASPGKGSHAGAAGFAPSSVTLDGVNDRIQFTGTTITLSAGKVLTASFWVNLDNIVGTKYILFGRSGGSGPVWRIGVATSEIAVLGQNVSSVTVVNFDSDSVLTASAWHHIMISFDLATASSWRMYIDGADAIDNVNTFTNDNVAFNRTDLNIGTDDSLDVDFGGCLAELWVDDVYTDFSNSTNRAKFYNAGAPVNLGTDGSTPFGSVPNLYMKFTAGSLGVNSGTGAATGTITGDVASGDCGAVGL